MRAFHYHGAAIVASAASLPLRPFDSFFPENQFYQFIHIFRSLWLEIVFFSLRGCVRSFLDTNLVFNFRKISLLLLVTTLSAPPFPLSPILSESAGLALTCHGLLKESSTAAAGFLHVVTSTTIPVDDLAPRVFRGSRSDRQAGPCFIA
jgi:hypothetical protein